MPFIACVTGILMSGECSSEALPVPRNHRVSAVGSPKMRRFWSLSLFIENAGALCARQMVTVMFLTQSHMPSSLLPQVRLVLRALNLAHENIPASGGSRGERVGSHAHLAAPWWFLPPRCPVLWPRTEHNYYYYFLIWKEHKPRCFPGGLCFCQR